MSTNHFGRVLRPLLLLLASSLLVQPAQGQTLTVQGDQFAIDGTPKFLVFISYFGAMGAPNIIQDLHLLKNAGFDGVRIWPNLDTGPQLMNGDGSLRPESLERLQLILDQARLEGLVVDVTFTYEHIPGMRNNASRARTGIVNATRALRSYENILFDIQNERNVPGDRFMSEGDVADIFNAIKAVHSERIVTADNSLAEDWGPQYAADFTRRLNLDVTAFHEERGPNWYTLPQARKIIGPLKSNGKPAYMQEPNRPRDATSTANDKADYFIQAMVNAKVAGAAAWCFHQLLGADMRSGLPFLEDRLHAFNEPDWRFVSSLTQRVVLRTSNNLNYLVPEGGGGGKVRADRTGNSPGSWEVVTVKSLSGGPLVSGDRVAFLTSDGKHYLQAIDGGGSTLVASSENLGAFETFTIERAGGGAIRHGEAVTLRANNSQWFVSATNAGGGGVTVNARSAGPWETFTILYVSVHSSEVAGPAPFSVYE